MKPFLPPLVGISALGIGLYVTQGIFAGKWLDWYLIWNLFLAWLPLVFAFGLVRVLRTKAWSHWQAIVLSILWLAFLPNSFYIVTDFIHIGEPYYTDKLFAAVLFMTFALAGLALGYMSLGMVQRELRKRMPEELTRLTAVGVLLLSSFAIYLGRDLRWNSWDIIFNPAGILFDVSDRLIDPSSHPQAFTTTATFFVFLTVLYFVLRSAVGAVRSLPKK